MISPRKDKPDDAPKHHAFREDGSCFPVDEPSHDGVTRFLRDAIPAIRSKFLSPASVELLLRTQPDKVRSAFPNASQWARWDRPWHWPHAQTSTSAESKLVRSTPDHLADPDGHRRWLEDAEHFHDYDCRFDRATTLDGYGLTPPTLECRVHGNPLTRTPDERTLPSVHGGNP